MRLCLHLILLFLSNTVLLNASRGQRYGGVVYQMRALNITECSETPDKPKVYSVHFNVYNMRQYINIEGELSENAYISLITIYVERCQAYRYGCERFFSFDMNRPCSLINMKGQLWSPVMDSIKPSKWKKTCPVVEKGVYRFVNSSIDVEAFMKLVPEASKYHWHGKITIHDFKSKIDYCLESEAYFVSYSKRTY